MSECDFASKPARQPGSQNLRGLQETNSHVIGLLETQWKSSRSHQLECPRVNQYWEIPLEILEPYPRYCA